MWIEKHLGIQVCTTHSTAQAPKETALIVAFRVSQQKRSFDSSQSTTFNFHNSPNLQIFAQQTWHMARKTPSNSNYYNAHVTQAPQGSAH